MLCSFQWYLEQLFERCDLILLHIFWTLDGFFLSKAGLMQAFYNYYWRWQVLTPLLSLLLSIFFIMSTAYFNIYFHMCASMCAGQYRWNVFLGSSLAMVMGVCYIYSRHYRTLFRLLTFEPGSIYVILTCQWAVNPGKELICTQHCFRHYREALRGNYTLFAVMNEFHFGSCNLLSYCSNFRHYSTWMLPSERDNQRI